MAEISVIVPVYKVEKYINRCIDSILTQTFRDFELILVDDGSPDKCGQICEEYARKDERIVVLHRENGGLSAARNTGIDWTFLNSGSKYITFVDSDDWLPPQYLDILYQTIINTKSPVSVVGFERVEKFESGKLYREDDIPEPEVLAAEEFFINHEWNFNYAWGKLYDRSYFAEVRYPVGKNYEDTFTTYRILFAGKQVAFIDCPLYYYFYNTEGISHSLWNPSELAVMEGIREQIRFYRDNGYARALEKEEQLYVNHFAYQICRIRENKADLKKNLSYLRELRKEMMRLIRKNPEKYGYRKMPQCYEAAYPTIMTIYHGIGKAFRFIGRKLKF